MDYETAKIKIRECKSRTGVYQVLEQFGVDTGIQLCRSLRKARENYRHKECEVIQCAQTRLLQIDNKEV